MFERHPFAITLLCLAALILATCVGARVGAQTLFVPSTSYQVEDVGTVMVWLDEARGLLCELVGTWPSPALSCVPLQDTVYGRQIQGN